jgi:hypothetical protein
MLSVSRPNNVDESLMDEYGTFCGMKIGRGKQRTGEIPPQLHFVNHKSHIVWPGIEHWPPQSEGIDWNPESSRNQREQVAGDFSTLKIEAIRSSETSVHTRSTRRHISEVKIVPLHLLGKSEEKYIKSQWGCPVTWSELKLFTARAQIKNVTNSSSVSGSTVEHQTVSCLLSLEITSEINILYMSA